MLDTQYIEEILSHFDLELSNFEIVNLEEKKGWSAKHLYLIVEEHEQFVLKGKSQDQLTGFMADIAISNFLHTHGFKVRKPIGSKDGDYHYIKDEIYWDVKKYVPGSVEEFAVYTRDSVISLAQVNVKHLTTSLNNPDVTNLGLVTNNSLENAELIKRVDRYAAILQSVLNIEPTRVSDWLHFAQEELTDVLAKNTDYSIIHNDLNDKNIVLDLSTMQVTSFIDWDHGCISTPLKDILEPLNMFFDFIPAKYLSYRELYLNTIKGLYPMRVSEAEINLLQTYFYALNKWKYITFFTKLIDELGNSTGEYSNLESVVRTQHAKLEEMGKVYNIF